MGKSTINGPFSIATLNYQRVSHLLLLGFWGFWHLQDFGSPKPFQQDDQWANSASKNARTPATREGVHSVGSSKSQADDLMELTLTLNSITTLRKNGNLLVFFEGEKQCVP